MKKVRANVTQSSTLNSKATDEVCTCEKQSQSCRQIKGEVETEVGTGNRLVHEGRGDKGAELQLSQCKA